MTTADTELALVEAREQLSGLEVGRYTLSEQDWQLVLDERGDGGSGE